MMTLAEQEAHDHGLNATNNFLVGKFCIKKKKKKVLTFLQAPAQFRLADRGPHYLTGNNILSPTLFEINFNALHQSGLFHSD